MKLVSAGCEGFRRFAGRAEMNLDGRVIAIVGPNEAGKTRFLEALELLATSSPIVPGQRSRDLERRPSRGIWARHRLEVDDLECIRDVPGGAQVRWYLEWKADDGQRYHEVEPGPKRDLRPRERAQKALVKAADHKLLREADGLQSEAAVAAAVLANELDSATETLSDDVIARCQETATFLRKAMPEDSPRYLLNLPEVLEALAKHESLETPSNQVLSRLAPRAARCVRFDQPHRDLHSEYDLDLEADNPPPALATLASLAGLDLKQLRDAISAEDWGRREAIVEAANVRLRERFAESWRQSGVFMRLATDSQILRILMSASEGGYTAVAERSDGLLAFLSLLAFIELQPSDRPHVLLIDEAETHLHYDGQADLVRVFSRQRIAQKIVYTTHSAGCLPQDLGGVRTVVAEGARSTIRNEFWVAGHGISPLLIGMGASVLAFTPSRYAVFGEGGSDFILLPTLLRDAAGISDLPFQVVPGLAQVPESDVPSLSLEAGKVAHFVDGDSAGSRIGRKLRRGGAEPRSIVALGGAGSGWVLEDMVQRDVYLVAVNEELARSHGQEVAIPAGYLRAGKNRPRAVERWCTSSHIDPPSKRAVAYRILELRAQGHTVVAGGPTRTALRTALRDLQAALGLT